MLVLLGALRVLRCLEDWSVTFGFSVFFWGVSAFGDYLHQPTIRVAHDGVAFWGTCLPT
jgi:hypothetical protein